MKKIAFLLILMLLIFACAANNTAYEQKLQLWIGQPESALLKSWGRPTVQKIMSDGQTILSYIKQNEYLVPTEYFYDYPGWLDSDIVYDPFFSEESFAPYAQITDTEIEETCQTSFMVQNGIIQSYKFQGNNCH